MSTLTIPVFRYTRTTRFQKRDIFVFSNRCFDGNYLQNELIEVTYIESCFLLLLLLIYLFLQHMFRF